MNLRVLEAPPTQVHVALDGRLDTAGVDAIEVKFNAAVVARRKDAVVDLSALEFLSSMGVRMLLLAAKALERTGQRMVLVARGPVISTALQHSAIDELIPVAQDLDQARAILAGGRP